MAREPVRVGLAGLGAVGLEVARRLEAGIPGLVLAAVAVRDVDKARRNLPQSRRRHCGRAGRKAGGDLRHRGRMPAAGVVSRRRYVGHRSRQAVHAARRRPTAGELGSGGAGEGNRRAHPGADRRADRARRGARRRRRHHPLGHHGHAQAAGRARRRAVSGRARHLAQRSQRGPQGVRRQRRAKARAVSRPTSTSPRRSASPASGPTARSSKSGPTRRIDRNTHRIEVDADTARFSMSIEGIPSANPRTGRIVPLSTVAALRGAGVGTESRNVIADLPHRCHATRETYVRVLAARVFVRTRAMRHAIAKNDAALSIFVG